MELYEAIQKRRSMRKYEDSMVSDEPLNRCLDAARWAPSWVNSQCTRYIIVKDPDTKEKLSELLSKTNPAKKAVASAPVVVVFVGKLGTITDRIGRHKLPFEYLIYVGDFLAHRYKRADKIQQP